MESSLSRSIRTIGGLVSLLLLIGSSLWAQEEVAAPPGDFQPASFFVEIGGNARLYSFNYDRRFSEHLTGRIGLMYFPPIITWVGESEALLVFPVMVNYLLGTGNHYLELGGGVVLGTQVSFSQAGLYPTATIGYRLQPKNGGFLFRLGFTPAFLLSEGNIDPWGGVSLGYVF